MNRTDARNPRASGELRRGATYPLTSRTRRLFPPTGPAYALFDAAVFLLFLAVIGYILTTPSSTQEQALSAPLDLLPDYVWGTALACVSSFAIVCSYFPCMVRRGYLAMIVACVFWSSNFAIGMGFGVAAQLLPVGFLDGYQFTARAFISVLLYGWIASRLIRDLPREVRP